MLIVVDSFPQSLSLLRMAHKIINFSAALQKGYAGSLSNLLSTPVQMGCSLAFLSLFQTQSTKFCSVC